MNEKKVSVIIPIYNAEKYLNDLFICLDNNRFFEGDEVLLVDNNSSDASADMCLKRVEQNPKLYRYIKYIDKADSYAARNQGVHKAQGDILVFTDSDCKPTEKWISTIRRDLKAGQVFAGDVKLQVVNNGIWECFDSISHLSQSRVHISQNRVATANMAVFRSDFDRVGMFEERFAGGDFEWSIRAASKGMKIIFSEEALIWHPSRKTYNEILTRERRGAYGVGKSAKNHQRALFPLLMKYFLRIFKFDIYIKIAHKMKIYDISLLNRMKFVCLFFVIRCKQLQCVIEGYKGVDARIIGVK